MTRPRRDSGALTMLGGAVLIALCCAGPVLVASGVLAGIGAAFRNPWLIASGAAVVLAAVVYATTRIARRHTQACCPPPDAAHPATSPTASQDQRGSRAG